MPGDATKKAPLPPGGLLLSIAALQFGFGFHGVVYTAFGGYFLRAKCGLAVPGCVWCVSCVVSGPVAPPVAPRPAARAYPPTGDGPLPIWRSGASGGTRTLGPPLRSRLLCPSTAPAQSWCDSRWNRADRARVVAAQFPVTPRVTPRSCPAGRHPPPGRRMPPRPLVGHSAAVPGPQKRGGTGRSPRRAPRLPGTRARDVVTDSLPAPHRGARSARGRLVSGA